MSPLKRFYLSDRQIVELPELKDALFQKLSLCAQEAAGRSFSDSLAPGGTISDSFWSGGGGTNLSQGDQAKVPALLYQVLLLEISAVERDIVKPFLKEKIYT